MSGSRPSAAAIRPVTALLPTTTLIKAMTNIAIQKYSAGPKNSVARASTRPMGIMAMAEAARPITNDQQVIFDSAGGLAVLRQG